MIQKFVKFIEDKNVESNIQEGRKNFNGVVLELKVIFRDKSFILSASPGFDKAFEYHCRRLGYPTSILVVPNDDHHEDTSMYNGIKNPIPDTVTYNPLNRPALQTLDSDPYTLPTKPQSSQQPAENLPNISTYKPGAGTYSQ